MKSFEAATQKLLESGKWPEREVKSMIRILKEDLLWNQNGNLELESDSQELLSKIIERLLRDEPIQYIVEKAYFYDRYFYVDNNVLIPRPETEELIHCIIQENTSFSGNILDIGTGSGCIAVLLADKFSDSKVTAWDISQKAIEIAKKNAESHQVLVEFSLQDILQKPNQQNWDIIVSNPPYIDFKEEWKMSPSTIQYEPHLALFVGDKDSLVFYKKIADYAFANLNEDGKLYFECNEFTADGVEKYVKSIGFRNVKLIEDLQGKNRICSAKK